MRGKVFILGVLMPVTMLLSSCTGVINGPADELRMYSWSGEAENGSIVSLSFDENQCRFRYETEDLSLELSGLCFADDDSLFLCDEKSGMNYSFGYRLYGDRVELSRDGSTVSLDKIKAD